MDNRQLNTVANYLAVDYLTNQAIEALDNYTPKEREPRREGITNSNYWRDVDLAQNRCANRLRKECLPKHHEKGVIKELAKLTMCTDTEDSYEALWIKRLSVFPMYQKHLIRKAKANYVKHLRISRASNK